jgi:hypothetical protein
VAVRLAAAVDAVGVAVEALRAWASVSGDAADERDADAVASIRKRLERHCDA